MDLGVSSYQLDEASRGFSYMKDAPLDMRMNREENLSAYGVINNYEEEELFKILKIMGKKNFLEKLLDL